MTQPPKRQFSVYELNRLYQHGIDPHTLDPQDHRPIEYVIGLAEFMGRDFEVNQHTLIPRVETEEIWPLLLKLLNQLKIKPGKISLADIGTGSGCLGISLFLELTSLNFQPKVYLSDISKKALAVTYKNMARLIRPEDKSQLQIFESNLLSDYPDHLSLDVIIANLPYIPQEKISQLDPSVKDFEPISALDGGGQKGLDLVIQLIKQAEKSVFLPQLLVLEIDEFVNLEDVYESSKYHQKIYQDSFGKNRFLVYSKKITQTP